MRKILRKFYPTLSIIDIHAIRSNNFSFKCHRRDQTPNSKDQSLVYAVNDISFHPVHGTFSTCGMLYTHLSATLLTRVYIRLRWHYPLLG